MAPYQGKYRQFEDKDQVKHYAYFLMAKIYEDDSEYGFPGTKQWIIKVDGSNPRSPTITLFDLHTGTKSPHCLSFPDLTIYMAPSTYPKGGVVNEWEVVNKWGKGESGIVIKGRTYGTDDYPLPLLNSINDLTIRGIEPGPLAPKQNKII